MQLGLLRKQARSKNMLLDKEEISSADEDNKYS